MSVEEDVDLAETELKELVTQTLEENGVLSKIRAQLRAGLYLSLENEVNISKKHPSSNSLKYKLAKPDVKIIFCLVKEFLDYFELDFTNTVYEKESYMGTLYNYEGREKLIKDLEINFDTIYQGPLLVEILNIARNNSKFSKSQINGQNLVNNYSSFINDSKEVNNATFDVPTNANKLESSLDVSDSVKNYTVPENSVNKAAYNLADVKMIPKELCETNDISISSIDSKGSDKLQNSSYGPLNERIEELPKNVTVDLLIPTKIIEQAQKFENDDTYEGTSSIAEDSILSNKEQHPLIDLDKTKAIPVPGTPVNSIKTLIDQTIDESPPNKSPRLLLSPESVNSEKKKNQKPMSSLTSLSDLPPLQVTKTRSPDTVLLPSLYSKEFREKSNLKEIDKLLDINFDSIDNYEEDFILSGSLDYERNKNINSVLLKNDHNKISETTKHFTAGKLYENTSSKTFDVKKNEDKAVASTTVITENNGNNELISNKSKISDTSTKETSSISEELDFNSNADEVLKLSSSN